MSNKPSNAKPNNIDIAKRNNAIANAILDGATESEVAKLYNLSIGTIKAIARKHTASTGVGTIVKDLLHSPALENITHAIEDALFKDGEDCGCDDREKKLNKIFPLGRRPRCMTEQMLSEYTRIRELPTLSADDRREIAVQHAYLFNHKFHLPCPCSPKTYINYKNDIEKVYQTYFDDADALV